MNGTSRTACRSQSVSHDKFGPAWVFSEQLHRNWVRPQHIKLKPDPTVVLERDSIALIKNLGLFRRKHHRPNAGLCGVWCIGGSVRTPIDLNAVIARTQAGYHPVKAVRTQRCFVEAKVAAVGRIERGARSGNRLKQVRADLDVAILISDGDTRRHRRGCLTT